MRSQRELFIGVTSWNSALFLPVCLRAIRANTRGLDVRVVVLDNCSTDRSTAIAKECGAEVLVEACLQADALNRLVSISDARYTLLMHADVVMLSPRWFELCTSKLRDNTILVSPEDIGCGPYSRPFGADKPESSFMFFSTQQMRGTAITRWRRWHRVPYPSQAVDFYGDHITHRLPARLEAKGYRWASMLVHCSDIVQRHTYSPSFRPGIWNDELAHLRYGLGNFYSLDGVITHYHNWYERVDMDVSADSTRTTGPSGAGFPVAYIKAYTQAFLGDHASGNLVIPEAVRSTREPRAL